MFIILCNSYMQHCSYINIEFIACGRNVVYNLLLLLFRLKVEQNLVHIFKQEFAFRLNVDCVLIRVWAEFCGIFFHLLKFLIFSFFGFFNSMLLSHLRNSNLMIAWIELLLSLSTIRLHSLYTNCKALRRHSETFFLLSFSLCAINQLSQIYANHPN